MSYYVLVQDECNLARDGDTSLGYVYFGTEEQVREEMDRLYWEGLEYYEWDHHYYEKNTCSLHDEPEKAGYDCHIAWWMVECPDFDPKRTRYILMKGAAHEGGGITTEVIGTYTSEYEAENALTRAFGSELANPSEYMDWQLEYCETRSQHALATVETMDAAVSFDVINVMNYKGDIFNDIERWFAYVG